MSILLHTTAVTNALEMVSRESNPTEGDETLVRTEDCVCQSNAGYYWGSWCIEWMGDTWLPQPYHRESGYFATPEEAQKWGDYSEQQLAVHISESRIDILTEDFNIYAAETGMDREADFDYERQLEVYINDNA